MASCCCFSRSILAVSRLAIAVFTREPPKSQRGTLLLATLPRVIAVCEIALAVLPSALLSSVQLMLSYFAGLPVPPIDEQPVARSTATKTVGADAAVEAKFMSASGSPSYRPLISIELPRADAHFVKALRPARHGCRPLRP